MLQKRGHSIKCKPETFCLLISACYVCEKTQYGAVHEMDDDIEFYKNALVVVGWTSERMPTGTEL